MELTPNVQEGAAIERRLTADELRANRDSYVPSPLAVEYDGPMDDGEPQPSCYRKWKKSRKGPFSRADVALIVEEGNDVPVAVEQAVRYLVEMVLKERDFDNKNPLYGRFEFSNGPKTAKEIRAAFRLLRQAVDFLEADFCDCEAEELAWTREKQEGYQELRERGY